MIDNVLDLSKETGIAKSTLYRRLRNNKEFEIEYKGFIIKDYDNCCGHEDCDKCS